MASPANPMATIKIASASSESLLAESAGSRKYNLKSNRSWFLFIPCRLWEKASTVLKALSKMRESTAA